MVKAYYQDEYVTVFHGDCRDVLADIDLMASSFFNEGKCDLLLTDPPYGIDHLMRGGKNTGHWNSLSSGNPWDLSPPDIMPIVEMAISAIVWGGNYFTLPPKRGWLAWRKTNCVPTQAQIGLAWTNLEIPAKLFSWPTGGTWKRVHPTQKPLELIQWCICFCKKSETILDPFMGSGTTLVSAKLSHKHAIGIDREEKYCEIAAKRLSQGVLEFVD